MSKVIHTYHHARTQCRTVADVIETLRTPTHSIGRQWNRAYTNLNSVVATSAANAAVEKQVALPKPLPRPMPLPNDGALKLRAVTQAITDTDASEVHDIARQQAQIALFKALVNRALTRSLQEA
eukprot:TRINITY_DN63991_c0_g3_i1.p1 TRINITY_DN63991_c0_g3~~TRINITY_DN63991_c0_g3_i1.p1  ORF type:complete len:133 (+),score=5.54 TRINITY_DN63991_c0_g3_i1:28-399(+)